MRLLLISAIILSGCTSIPQHRVNDTLWSDHNYQIMLECGAMYSSDADYSECLLINNATI